MCCFLEVHSVYLILGETILDIVTIIVSTYLTVRLYKIYKKFNFDILLNFIFGFILLSGVALSELFGFFASCEGYAKSFFRAVGVFAILALFNYTAILSKIKRGYFEIKTAIISGTLTYFILFDILTYDIFIFKSEFTWDYSQYCSFYCNLATGIFMIALGVCQLKILSDFLQVTKDSRRNIILRGYMGSVVGTLVIGLAFLLEPWVQTSYLMYFGGLGVFVFVVSFAYTFIKYPHLAFLVPYRVKAVILYNRRGDLLIGEYYENFLDDKTVSTLIKTINSLLDHEKATKNRLVKYIRLLNDVLIFHAQKDIVGFALVERYHPYIERLFKRTIDEITHVLEVEKLDPNILTRELTQKIQKILSEKIYLYTFVPRVYSE